MIIPNIIFTVQLYHKFTESHSILYNFQTGNRFVCLWLIHTQTLHEPAVLLGCQASCFAFVPGPLEAAGLQSLVQRHKVVALPVQSLDPVSPSAAEEEQRIGEGVQPELLFDKSGQAVNPKPEVGAAAGDYDAVCTGEICQHDFRPRSTVSTVVASAPL